MGYWNTPSHFVKAAWNDIHNLFYFCNIMFFWVKQNIM